MIPTTAPIAIRVDTAHRIQTIRPIRAIGTAVDSDPKGEIALLYDSAHTKLMRSTGLGTLTYRLYTELSIQDWHWNPAGTFSDAAHAQGYWTSSADPRQSPITDSFGYTLPRRGNSRDQGNDNGYSRIDDGDPNTYWKSNPYLTHAFTGEPDSAHPQWVALQFLHPVAVDAIRIAWVNPYATSYAVQYWSGNPDAILHPADGAWHTFAHGTVTGAKGGTQLVKLAAAPVSTTFVRVLMSASSNTCVLRQAQDDKVAARDDRVGAQDDTSKDVRDCVGYAIQDVGVGTVDAAGAFHDLVVRSTYGSCHGELVCQPDPKRQTLVWTSSVDPWHRANDKVQGDADQTGLDLIARSPLTRGLPTIYPVALFYSTPQNAANEVAYLEARHYPIAEIEMGEEVDGQYATPEDYGALYIEFAKAIHAVDPHVRLGGPVFEGVDRDDPAWANARGDTSWLHRFIAYLKSRGHLRDLAFMSWEHYPYHHCDRGAKLQSDLLDEPSFVRRMVATWRHDGATMPLLETEDNFSPDGTDAPQHVYGALWLSDFIGASLASGVSYMTYYQAEAESLGHSSRCNSWGAYNPYIVDNDNRVRAKGAAYDALQLLTMHWALPGDGAHGVYPVSTSLGDRNAPVTAYALHRPDGAWSVLVVNKDWVARRVTIRFEGHGAPAHFTGGVHVVTFGKEQYHWNGNPADVPNPDTGLQSSTVSGGQATYLVPARSLTVFRGAINP